MSRINARWPPQFSVPCCGERTLDGSVPEPDDQGMTTTTAPLLDVRCACVACGAHLIGTMHHRLSGQCSNCGSYEVRPLPVAPRPKWPRPQVPPCLAGASPPVAASSNLHATLADAAESLRGIVAALAAESG
jgi:hypothetical protein